MNSTSECHCGCGAKITYDDPSPDFKWPQCQKLWLASVDKAEPGHWRFEQRTLNLLIRVRWEWENSEWDFEWTDVHLCKYDYEGEGTDPARGLATLYEQYEQQLAAWGRTSTLPILTRPSPVMV